MKFMCISLSSFGCLSLLAIILVLSYIPTMFFVSKSHEKYELFELSIIHVNDFHARFDEISDNTLPCYEEDEKCIGGYARIARVVKYLKSNRRNSIYLNAGDNFQGTYWYNLLRHNVTSHFLNLVPADAITLGNHEFAHGVSGLIPFLKSIKSTIIVANIDDRHEESMQNLYEKSIVIERNGRKIGIIGVILRETSQIANTGKLKFTNEIHSIEEESIKMRQEDVNIIIVLSHCGLDRDIEIARETGDYVDIIVGGHSHSFLYTTKDNLYPASDIPIGSYPIIITASNDRKVLIVHAAAFSKYVGDLKVYFSPAGHIKYYDGNPIFLGNEIKKDPNVEFEVLLWRDEVNRVGQRIVGATKVDMMHKVCRHGECILGSFISDAFIRETQIEYPDSKAYAAIIQAGGIKSSFRVGNIYYADIVACMPFENTLDILEIGGDAIYDIFEHSVSRSFVTNEFIGIHMLQISGIKVTFNTSKIIGNRVRSLQIKINDAEYESVLPSKLYTLVVSSFLAHGGDGFSMIKSNKRNHRIGLLDIDIISSYITKISNISYQTDGRIVMLT